MLRSDYARLESTLDDLCCMYSLRRRPSDQPKFKVKCLHFPTWSNSTMLLHRRVGSGEFTVFPIADVSLPKKDTTNNVQYQPLVVTLTRALLSTCTTRHHAAPSRPMFSHPAQSAIHCDAGPPRRKLGCSRPQALHRGPRRHTGRAQRTPGPGDRALQGSHLASIPPAYVGLPPLPGWDPQPSLMTDLRVVPHSALYYPPVLLPRLAGDGQ